MATQLGSKALMSIVKVKENNVAQEFYVVRHNAYAGGRTLLLRRYTHSDRQWHSSNVNAYASCTLDVWFNNDYFNTLPADIRGQIAAVTIPYIPGNGNWGLSNLSRMVFAVSATELGQSHQYMTVEGTALANASTLKIATDSGGNGKSQWTRSPYTSIAGNAWDLSTDGSLSFYNCGCADSCSARPAFTLPSSLLVSDDGSVTTNTAPTTPASITVPATVNGGSSIIISWSASTDAQGNLAGYKVERSIDGGSTWAQIHQSAGTSCTDNITFGWQTVQYRVKAYDTEGLESGWKVSDQREVYNNTAPSAPPSISVPLSVIGGESLTVSWGSSTDAEGNLTGYRLERKVAAGAWTQIYQGAALAFQDSITKGWTEVTYHVCAYDSAGATSSFVTSPARAVDNNTAPTIACSSHGDIGEKAAGFTISYTVNDADGDAVTVVEAIDGAQKRTFSATLGASNSFAVTGEYFMCLLNGQHTMTVTATDAGGKNTVLTLTFAKTVHRLRITMEVPDVPEPDQLITKTVLNITRYIPSDATFTVKVTNNAKDTQPVWEDATSSVMSGINYLFENTTIAKGNAYAFEIIAERGASGEGGFIKTIGGAFE